MTIDVVKIFPPIGIARLGNSPNEFFIGPEKPGDHTPPSGGYKDSSCQIKRQAARFHIFGYEADVLKQEITMADAEIKWTVELANTKADWKVFDGIEPSDLSVRNEGESDRASLRITPGPRTLNGPNEKNTFGTGTFKGVPVPLGEIRTDAVGCLLVLGGFGKSGSPDDTPLDKNEFANNDGWYDDVSDGPVTASVRFKGTNEWIPAASAWVICGPPKFAPAIGNMITLYDTLRQVAVSKLGAVSLLPPERPSFSKDIYPLLIRAMNLKWVSEQGAVMHSVLQDVIKPPGPPGRRIFIFSKLRNPDTDPHELVTGKNMPKIHSDYFLNSEGHRITQPLTNIQYNILKQWKDNNFDIDGDVTPIAETEINPEGLTRAALESCVGGPFVPGIETSFMTRDNYPFIEPFRLDSNHLSPGDLTKQLAIPWQVDFFLCSYEDPNLWWPAQRPDQVITTSGGSLEDWARGIADVEGMVKNWHKLGFVVQKVEEYVETERCE